MPADTLRTTRLQLADSPETERHEGAITEPLEDQAPVPRPQDEALHEGVPASRPELKPGEEQPVPEHDQAGREAGADTGPLEDQRPAG